MTGGEGKQRKEGEDNAGSVDLSCPGATEFRSSQAGSLICIQWADACRCLNLIPLDTPFFLAQFVLVLRLSRSVPNRNFPFNYESTN